MRSYIDSYWWVYARSTKSEMHTAYGIVKVPALLSTIPFYGIQVVEVLARLTVFCFDVLMFRTTVTVAVVVVATAFDTAFDSIMHDTSLFVPEERTARTNLLTFSEYLKN
jgi:hypothetical protein